MPTQLESRLIETTFGCMGCAGEANIRPCDSNINRVSSKALCLIASGLLGAETDHAMSLCEKLISYSVVGHGWSRFGASAVRVIWPKAGDSWIRQACWAPNGTVTHEWLAHLRKKSRTIPKLVAHRVFKFAVFPLDNVCLWLVFGRMFVPNTTRSNKNNNNKVKAAQNASGKSKDLQHQAG